MRDLIGKVVRITSDNENYTEYLGKEFVIVECYYQEDRDDEPIYDLEFIDVDEVFPFSLYEWEFEVV
jgi:hypothetical protein